MQRKARLWSTDNEESWASWDCKDGDLRNKEKLHDKRNGGKKQSCWQKEISWTRGSSNHVSGIVFAQRTMNLAKALSSVSSKHTLSRLWGAGTVGCLQYTSTHWSPVLVLTPLLLIQILANVPGRQQIMTQALSFLSSSRETETEFLALSFGLLQSKLLWAFGERIADGISVTLPFKTNK